MRRIDKKLNMVKANLLNESRYLESKGLIKENELGTTGAQKIGDDIIDMANDIIGRNLPHEKEMELINKSVNTEKDKRDLINKIEILKKDKKSNLKEYDRDSMQAKYSNLDKDRMNNIIDYSMQRQIREGVKFKALNQKHEYYVTEDDIAVYEDRNSPIEPIVTTMKNLNNFFNDNGELTSHKLQRNNIKSYDIIDMQNKRLKEFDFKLKGDMRNVISPSFGDKTTNKNNDNETIIEYRELSFDIDIYGKLIPLTDKYITPFKFHINKITVKSNSGGDKGIIQPFDVKNQVLFNNIIQNKINEKFGKYDLKNPFFIKEINIDRNASIM